MWYIFQFAMLVITRGYTKHKGEKEMKRTQTEDDQRWPKMTRVARLSILSILGILGILCISEIGSTPHASPEMNRRVSLDWFSRENLKTGNPWFWLHQIDRAFQLKLSHHPILWILWRSGVGDTTGEILIRPAMICRCKSLASAIPPEAKASRMASHKLLSVNTKWLNPKYPKPCSHLGMSENGVYPQL